jgi:hypothetical protein
MKKRVTITNRNYESFLGFTKREKEIEKRGRQRDEREMNKGEAERERGKRERVCV